MVNVEKTVRFAAVVKRAGTPAAYLLWTSPKRDPKFQSALADHQVMTVHREVRGTRADHGEIGYRADRNALFLLFPKSLRRFRDCRVIGIDYDLLATGTAVSGAGPAFAPERKHAPASPKLIPEIAHFPEKENPLETPSKAKVSRPASRKNPRAAAHLDRQTAGQIREAVRELKTGRYVAAYTRLNALLTPRA